ncbi:DHHW family protein [Sutcliffiella halmapala]|uniref:DHHW family protein n=1 Tax=Sutcliffiella halmapala TaxID=79882 RepID=UPI001474555D|nr:DHHW family protein [Sutcliffiella halmapala]
MSVGHRVQIVLFICIVGGIGLMNLLAEDRTFSEHENRVLTQMPEFSIQRFVTGRYMSDFEEYVSDQFIWKDFWTGIKAEVQKATLKQENNGVFFGKNEFLFEGYDKPKEKLYQNIESLNYFANKAEGKKVYLMLAPTSVEIYSENLPFLATSFSQKEVLEEATSKLTDSIKLIDVLESFRHHKEENLYFRTDHHWTMRGAYYAYAEAAKIIGFKPNEISDFTTSNVSKEFYGTFHSKANLRNVKPDVMEIFQPEFTVSYEVEYKDNQRTTPSLYEWKHLNTKDKYAFFLDGNHSLLTITSTIKNGRKLAVIKDSYAHALIPFLVNHYEEVHVIDLRYNHSNIYDYLAEQGISEVLFLYNIANFSTDSNMIWLKQ